MPFQTKYLYSAALDVELEKDALFNEVYNTEHMPQLLEVPGVVSVTRFKKQELTLIIDGERKPIVFEDEPSYVGLFEIESPEVLVCDAWVKAAERGRWPKQVRPYCKNRRLVLYKKLA